MQDLFGEEKMLALSWKQPFATAMLFGKIETRTWRTAHRGLVLICTSQAPYNEEGIKNITGDKQFKRLSNKLKGHKESLEYNGYAIAVGRLVNCRKMTSKDENNTFVEHKDSLYCHVYEDVRPIKPFPWKAAQGWKKVEKSIIDSIEYI